MTTKYVVCRYNEDLSWLTSLPKEEVIVYNKGQVCNEHKWDTILAPNIGREAESYLRYIIDNYHDLPDVVVFTQGRISDHVSCGSCGAGFLKTIAGEARVHGNSRTRLTIAQETDEFTNPTWNLKNGTWYLDSHYKAGNITFNDWFLSILSMPLVYPMYLYWNALFAVSKERIRSRSLQFYERLIEQVNYSSSPVEAHFFERAWYYIFNCHKK